MTRRRSAVMVLAVLGLALGLVAAVAAVIIGPARADAATTAPCAARLAGQPADDVVRPDGPGGADRMWVIGSGQIGGCPKTAGSVALTVCLQVQAPDGSWADETYTADGATLTACQTYARAWPAAYRYARQAGGPVLAPCVLAPMRAQVRGALADGTADGFETSREWHSGTVTGQPRDSGLCGIGAGGGGP